MQATYTQRNPLVITMNVALYENAFSFLSLPFEAGLIQIELGLAGVAGFFEAFVLRQFILNC